MFKVFIYNKFIDEDCLKLLLFSSINFPLKFTRKAARKNKLNGESHDIMQSKKKEETNDHMRRKMSENQNESAETIFGLYYMLHFSIATKKGNSTEFSLMDLLRIKTLNIPLSIVKISAL